MQMDSCLALQFIGHQLLAQLRHLWIEYSSRQVENCVGSLLHASHQHVAPVQLPLSTN
jgi:hypothetical protein